MGPGLSLRADRCISANLARSPRPVPVTSISSIPVMSVDPEMKPQQVQKAKYLLRHAFEGDYLPLPILYREKAAFSDAVGHSMVDYLKAYAETKYTDDEMKLRAAKYPFATPFTKESLLYREIFEKILFRSGGNGQRTFGCRTKRGRAATSTIPAPACSRCLRRMIEKRFNKLSQGLTNSLKI